MTSQGALHDDSLLARIAQVADTEPNRIALIELDIRGSEVKRQSFGELFSAVLRVSKGLRRLPEGAALINPSGAIDFAVAFLACLNSGRIAVTAPDFASARLRDRALGIAASVRPTVVLTSTDQSDAFKAAGFAIAEVGELRDTKADTVRHWPDERVAFVQYSSGSTDAPRGIAITHGNLNANQMMITSAFGMAERDITLTWLPRHHDMGLIGTLLQPLWAGTTCVSMPPMGFVLRPLTWLRAIQTYQASIIGAPSFGYRLCLRRVPERDAEKLDLSRLRIAFCGAEPVDGTMLSQFARRFAPAGFSPRAWLPCYGMAEATLLAAAAPPQTELVLATTPNSREQTHKYVSCGVAPAGAGLTLRDPATGDIGFGVTEGEICISGPHVSPGLWDPDSGEVTPFSQRLINEGGREWLRTGDMGFIAEGDVFPIDRIDDAITLYGRTIPAIDLENAVRRYSGAAEVEASAAFASASKAIILIEFARKSQANTASVLQRISTCITHDFGIQAELRAVARGTLPRTSSGKVKRGAARVRFSAGDATTM